ncbi:MAG: hypothetical protein WBH03_10740, partial [Cyclobacteriaceae bacterium]
MAGFDVVIEVDDDAITRLLRSQLKINGAPASPPFELVANVSSPLATGSTQLIVDDLTLTCQADDVATLRLGFSCWTINVTTPAGPVDVNGLVGAWEFAIAAQSFLRQVPGSAQLGLTANALPVPMPHLSSSSFADLDAVAPGGASAFLDLVAPQ